MRLQSLDKIDPAEIEGHPILGRQPKIQRALRHLAALAEERE